MAIRSTHSSSRRDRPRKQRNRALVIDSPCRASLHELLRARVDRLSPPARTVATAAAALSRPSADTLDAAFGLDLAVDAALLEAEEAGILTSDGGQLAFSHPLLAAALYGSLTGTRLRALHRRLAAVAADPEERARHLARGVRTEDDEAAAAIEQAAALATRRGAPESAAELYEAAARLTPAANPDDAARRLVGGATAMSIAGDLRRAEALARDALETRAVGIAPSARTPVAGLTGHVHRDDRGPGRLPGARARAKPGTTLALRIEILIALFEQIALDPRMAERRADEAIDLLRAGHGQVPPGPGPDHEVHRPRGVRAGGAMTGCSAKRWRSRPRATDRRPPIRCTGTTGSTISRPPARATACTLTRARARGDVVGAAELVEFLAMAEFRAGNWVEAEQALDDACETLGSIDAHGPFLASLADRSVIDAHRGRIERARQTLSTILDGSAHVRPLLADWWGTRRRVPSSSAPAITQQLTGPGPRCGPAPAPSDGSTSSTTAASRITSRRWSRSAGSTRRAVCSSTWSGGVGRCRGRGSMPVCRAPGPSCSRLTARWPKRWRSSTRRRRRSCVAVRARAPAARAGPARTPEQPEAGGPGLARPRRSRSFEALGSPPWARRARDELARIGLRHRRRTS